MVVYAIHDDAILIPVPELCGKFCFQSSPSHRWKLVTHLIRNPLISAVLLSATRARISQSVHFHGWHKKSFAFSAP